MKKVALLVSIFAFVLWSCGTPLAQDPPTDPVAPAPPKATAVPCAGAPDASAQKLILIVQTRDGQNVASGGILIREGESASFGPSGETLSAGFWESMDNGKYTVSFSDTGGKTVAVVELQGNVQWDETQCIVSGEDSFIRIAIGPDEWLNISKHEVKEGLLLLTDEKGNHYQVVSFGPQFYGVMTKP